MQHTCSGPGPGGQRGVFLRQARRAFPEPPCAASPARSFAPRRPPRLCAYEASDVGAHIRRRTRTHADARRRWYAARNETTRCDLVTSSNSRRTRAKNKSSHAAAIARVRAAQLRARTDSTKMMIGLFQVVNLKACQCGYRLLCSGSRTGGGAGGEV